MVDLVFLVPLRNLDFQLKSAIHVGAKVLAVNPPRGPPLEIERARANDGHKRCALKRVRQFGQAYKIEANSVFGGKM